MPNKVSQISLLTAIFRRLSLDLEKPLIVKDFNWQKEKSFGLRL
jgi:hypothetical protein